MARKQGSHSDITGPKIRAAALRLFAQHGYAAVSMRQIAADVGVQAGALYNYTPDKQSLLLDLLRTHMIEALADASKLDLSGDPAAALDRFVRFHISYNEPRRDQIFLSYMELRNLTPENFAIIEEYRHQYELILEQILERGVLEKTFNINDVRITVRAIIAQLNGINNWYRRDGRLSVGDVQEIYSDLVRRAVGG